MNEQVVVTLRDEHVLLVSEQTYICIQFLAGCKLFHGFRSFHKQKNRKVSRYEMLSRR